jgi:hypothetical protein
LQKSDVTLYAIGLLSQEPSDKRRNAERLLKEATKVSGGAAYFPRSAEEVELLATQIAHDIRNQYVIEFPVPPGTKPGSHTIRVTAQSNTRGKLAVRTRPSYVYGTTTTSSAVR